MYTKYQQCVYAHLFLSPFGDHGIGHTKRVLYLASEIAKAYALNDAEKKILALACCYHDIGRTHDWTDDDHGRDSAEKMVRLKLDKLHNLSKEDLDSVLNLIVMHSLDDELFVGGERELLLYKILKDADALDRLRFDDLNEKYLRLPESKEMIQTALDLIAHGIVTK